MFLEWSKGYGDIFSLKTLNSTAVVISSAASRGEHILDTNGARTGNRPCFVPVQRVTKGYLIALENMENPVSKTAWRNTYKRNKLNIRTSSTKPLKTQRTHQSDGCFCHNRAAL